MKSLQCIYKKQAINFAPVQSAEGLKCSSKENEELNQGNKILLVPTRALNLNQVTVGNGPVVCPCTTTSATIKRKGTSHNLWASHAASLGQWRKSPLKLFSIYITGRKGLMLCHINPSSYVFVFGQELLLKLQSQDTRVCFSFKQESTTGNQVVGYYMTDVLMALVTNM